MNGFRFRTRERYEQEERERLAPWAACAGDSIGRLVPEAEHAYRTAFQRDRDRIVHARAFRRLEFKTQVFVYLENDHYRNRLTHTIEAAQIARTIARALYLNEDLAEAITLAHDLGHTPFGHAGQDALQACMTDHGGFEHNLQSLRVVDHLEARYAAFDGLNLSFETREGILKHCSHRNAERLVADEPDGPARRFLHGGQPSLEAQLVNLADELAYSAHDVDDGVRSGLITLEQLQAVPLLARGHAAVMAAHPGLAPRRALHETLRRLLSDQVADLIFATTAALRSAEADHGPLDAHAVRQLPPLVQTSVALRDDATALKRFLFAELYRHPRVAHMTALGRTVIAELFAAYTARPAEMPADFARGDESPRAVADYIAGMTDRFAQREHQRLTGQRLFD